MKPCPPEFTPPACLRSPVRGAPDAIVALDAEWHEVTPSTEAAWGTNRLLSTQLACVWPARDEDRSDTYDEWINYHASEREPPRIEDLLAHVVQVARANRPRQGPGVETSGPLVLLLTHNGLAEFSHLAPSSPPLVSWTRGPARLRYLQKCPVTHDPIVLRDRVGPWRLAVRDTMLLAAQGQKALKQIAKQNRVHNKVDLADEIRPEHAAAGAGIARMDLLLELDPALFARYAMSDVRATLEYYLGFQRLGAELFDLDKPSMTVSGMAQAAFLAQHDPQALFACHTVVEPDEHGRMRPTAILLPERLASESLARNAFHGGYNLAFDWGWA